MVRHAFHVKAFVRRDPSVGAIPRLLAGIWNTHCPYNMHALVDTDASMEQSRTGVTILVKLEQMYESTTTPSMVDPFTGSGSRPMQTTT